MNTVVGLQKEAATAEKTPSLKRTLDQKTMDNLSTAMHGEAFAYVKYLLYAEHARKNGNKELAELFEKTAKVERFEHFNNWGGPDDLKEPFDRPDYRCFVRSTILIKRSQQLSQSHRRSRFSQLRATLPTQIRP